VKPASDLDYFLDVEGDRVPLEGTMTLGRHLDNDLVLSGEDVLDYHLRLELTGRGPRAIPLGEASLRVSGRDYSDAVGLMPGDRLEIGQNQLELAVEVRHPAEAEEWHLHPAGGDGSALPLAATCRVGRSAENDLQLDDDHVSRFHAELAGWRGSVWVRDFASANGTFVNGERIGSACRLYHGDEVRFDTHAFQLIGRGGDLTPVNLLDPALRCTPIHVPPSDRSTVSGDTVELVAVPEDTPAQTAKPPRGEAGAFLLGASELVAGITFRTPMGLTVIGRREDCDLVLRDRTVSSRHAELRVRAEGATITNLMATNGTWVNGSPVQSARLHDGDVLRLGRVHLVFREVAPSERAGRRLQHARVALLLGSLILAVGIITILW
jgi:pSer/pThr/pTyr-binding forkhead associated (FHA) protein